MRKLIRETVLRSMFETISRCHECGWSWEIDAEDDNPHLCHECGYDSKKGEYDMAELNHWKLISELEEAYPTSFDMEQFKALTSFAARQRYCDEHLGKALGSGTARKVYKIDDQKVLKLAKNQKGIAQNEEEIRWGEDSYFSDILAQTFDSHPQAHWVEMEIARPVKKADFKAIEDIPMDVLFFGVRYLENNVIANKASIYNQANFQEVLEKHGMDEDDVWENELFSTLHEWIHAINTAGDLDRKSSYGIVKRNGQDNIVIIDYGLSSDVYASYYGRN